MKLVLNFTIVLQFLFLMTACAQEKEDAVPNPYPKCDDIVGIWHNDLCSSLIIEYLNSSTGEIKGKYVSPSGGGSYSFPLIGWVNDANVNSSDPCKDCKDNNAKVISFTVRWGAIGSITGWVGTCSNTASEVPQIKTMWNLARPNSQFDWDHIINGSDTFYPGPPPDTDNCSCR